MKKILLVLLLMVGVAIAYFPLKKQIPVDADAFQKEDSIKNRNLAMQQIDSVFKSGRSGKIVTPLYHDFNPHYELLSSSQKSKVDKKNELYQLYNFRPEQLTNWEYPLHVLGLDISMENSQRGKEWYEPLKGGNYYGIWQSGWALGCAKMISGEKYICYMVIPYMVGYLRQSESYYYEFKPTIREALNTAYDFYTKNEQSDFVNFIDKDNLEAFMSLTSETSSPINTNNYSFKKIENEKSDFEWANPGVFEGTSYMYNGYIRVYICMAYCTTYALKYDSKWAEWEKKHYIESHEKELDKRIIISEIALSIILILLIVVYIIQRKKSKETILDKVIKSSNPKRYLRKYKQETLDAANQIYQKAINTSKEDQEAINELCQDAEAKLGIKLVRKKDIKLLQKKCNPRHFMKPYDADKVTKANVLYSRLKQDNIKYAEYVRLKAEVELLYL